MPNPPHRTAIRTAWRSRENFRGAASTDCEYVLFYFSMLPRIIVTDRAASRMTTGGRDSPRLQRRVPAMIPDNDLDYNVVREAEERLAITNATDPSAKRVHRQLAALYADRAWAARDAMFDADGRPGALERTRPA